VGGLLESSGIRVETLNSFFRSTTAELGRIAEKQVLDAALRTVTPQSEYLFVACSQ
jgi:maleate cis-trans isomerase